MFLGSRFGLRVLIYLEVQGNRVHSMSGLAGNCRLQLTAGGVMSCGPSRVHSGSSSSDVQHYSDFVFRTCSQFSAALIGAWSFRTWNSSPSWNIGTYRGWGLLRACRLLPPKPTAKRMEGFWAVRACPALWSTRALHCLTSLEILPESGALHVPPAHSGSGFLHSA